MYLLRAVLWPVFLALVLAYLFDPLIDRFERRHIPRSIAIFLCVLTVVAALAVLIFLVAPSVQRELVAMAQNLPRYTARFKELALPWLERLAGTRLPASLEGMMETASGYVANLPPDVIRPFASLFGRILSNTATLLLSLLNLILIPVFTFYFLRDFDRYVVRLRDLVPLPYRDWTLEQARKVDQVLGGFVRGQLSVCTILAVLYSLGLWLVGIDLAFVIGVSAGYLFIIPYLGTVLGLVAASVMALLEFRDVLHVLLVCGVFGVAQLVEGYLLTPKLVGSKVGLSPVAVILALLVGGGLFGFLGVLIAIPVAAVLKILFGEFLRVYVKSPVYTGDVH